MVLPYHSLRHHPHLKLSPAGVIQQRNRRPRTIVDYSYSGINQAMTKIAPGYVMQFGRALQRLLQRIVNSNPRFGPVYMCKVDLSDGYYRIPLTSRGCLELAVPIPSTHRWPLLAVPSVLPMGWSESCPYFCMATETIADATNKQPRCSFSTLPHAQDVLAAAQDQLGGPTAISSTLPAPLLPQHPIDYTDVYIDDFMLLAQTHRVATTLRRRLFHNIHKIFRPNTTEESTASPPRREPISEKKLAEGDCSWDTKATLLGWLVDSVAGTLRLPPHRHERLHALIDSLLPADAVPVASWHQLLGELRSMQAALPGGSGLFSVLQHALSTASPSQVALRPATKICLRHWKLLASSLADRPTALHDLVPMPPQYVGACDASKAGMGGIWLPTSWAPNATPFVWRSPFPPDITANVVSAANPSGQLNNSILELAGTLAHDATLLHAPTQCQAISASAGSDNSAAIGWLAKASVTTDSPVASLLHLRARLHRAHRLRSTYHHVPG